jgi:hypothetical protein
MKITRPKIVATLPVSVLYSGTAKSNIQSMKFEFVAHIKLFVVLIGAFFCILITTSSCAEEPPLSMTISSTPTIIDPKEDYFIDIKIENISRKPFYINHYITLIGGTDPYDVHVKDHFNRVVNHRTDLRHPDQPLPVYRTSFVTLEPGEFVVDRLVLDDLFDLSKPGQYTIQIDRKLPPEWGGWELHSNQITITIAG